MLKIKINNSKNAILWQSDGQIDIDDATDFVARFKSATDRMEPGFIIISDLTRFVPTDEKVREILHKAMQYAVENGVSRTVRIVNDSVASQIGKVQLNRTARELGYQTDVVNSMDEAVELLGW